MSFPIIILERITIMPVHKHQTYTVDTSATNQ